MAERVRLGFIGAGWWATANHMPLLVGRDDVELTAVCRLGAEELAREHLTLGWREVYQNFVETVEDDERALGDGVVDFIYGGDAGFGTAFPTEAEDLFEDGVEIGFVDGEVADVAEVEEDGLWDIWVDGSLVLELAGEFFGGGGFAHAEFAEEGAVGGLALFEEPFAEEGDDAAAVGGGGDFGAGFAFEAGEGGVAFDEWLAIFGIGYFQLLFEAGAEVLEELEGEGSLFCGVERVAFGAAEGFIGIDVRGFVELDGDAAFVQLFEAGGGLFRFVGGFELRAD